MKLSTIPQIYRNVNRGTEILSVLSKYGLADWISRFNLDFAKGLLKDPAGEALARQTRESRIRMALSELGPTAIKLGQLLSTRPDVVGPLLATELQQLQGDAPVDLPQIVRRTIEEELGQPVKEIFSELDDAPIASASIGQVHCAVLCTGQRVVVKVQHAGIAETIRKDVDVLGGLAQLADRIPEFRAFHPSATMAEFQRTLLRELDFGREERNLQLFATRFADRPEVRIPQPISELCTPRVLTMEHLEGIKLSDLALSDDESFDYDLIARSGAELYLEMIFGDGCYHADPHPGNLLILPGNVIGLLDFGMVGRIDERLREDMEEMMYAFVQRDATHLALIIMRVGNVPTDLDESALRADVADLISQYGSQQIGKIDMAPALMEVTHILHRFHIILPAQLAMLIKTLVTLEGTSKQLCPSFSVLDLMQPFQRRALLRRFSPTRRIKKMRRVYLELEQLADGLPRRILDIVRQVQEGKFDVHLEHRGLAPSINRLVLGMLASALFLGSSLMLSRQVPPLIFPDSTVLGIHKISILGISGCVVSLLVGLRLLLAIGKSGHLDERD